LTLNNREGILVVGLGHIGQPLAAKLAQAGFTVQGIDTNEEVVDKIHRGESHILEPGLSALINENLNKKLFVSSPSSIEISNTSTIMICVESVYDTAKQCPDLASLRKSVSSISRTLKRGQLIILRSTVPVGTTAKMVAPTLEKSGLRMGSDFGLAYCPERIVEGAALQELGSIPQIIGTVDEQSQERASAIFSKLTSRVIPVSSFETAEAIKLTDNVYRDTRFAFANTIAELCEHMGLNVHELINAANLDYPRNSIPVPSPGVGGSCIPKDSRFMMFGAQQSGFQLPLVDAARQVNEDGPIRLAKRIGKAIPLNSAKVFVAGIAFKGVPETEDTRDSPTIALIDELEKCGATLFGYDPAVNPEQISEFGLTPMETLDAGLSICDVCVFMTNHREFTELTVDDLIQRLPTGAIVVDGWGIFEPDECESRGIRHIGVGVG
jgi:UDP-N-acetyl-D-mannosaminuronic acid dehydrogenase